MCLGSRGQCCWKILSARENHPLYSPAYLSLERIVHARGSAAHGYFQPYKSLSDITKADFLSDPNKITPVFVRFSTVQGGAGSADTVVISWRCYQDRRGYF
ncbi:catalase [Escherichia coli]